MRIVSNIRVGKPDTAPDTPSHTNGIRAGNELGNLEKNSGFHPDGKMVKGSAGRSTGINPDSRNPIDPRMPNLSPP